MKKIFLFGLTVFLVSTAIFFAACKKEGLTEGSSYLPSAEVLERIAATSLEPMGGGGLRFGTATMQPAEGNMLVVHLTGPTPYELGYQHGILLKESINKPSFQYWPDPLYHGQPPSDLSADDLAKKMGKADEDVFGPIERNTPREYLEELKGIADGSGLDFKTVFRATFLSDYDMITLVSSALSGECSGVMASGGATSSGKLVVGRNTDYGGQKQWMENQVILVYDYPGAYRYASVSTAGLLKCNNAMNEAGMVVSGHFMSFLGGKADGYSFTIFENEIMRRTDNLEEVKTLLRTKPRCGSFGLIVGDGKSGQALAFEATKPRLGIREMQNDSIVLTNFALTPQQKPYDIASLLNIQMRDLFGRYSRLASLVNDNFGAIDPVKMAEFMSDRMDMIPEVQRERGAGNTVCGRANVTSVVFQPADNIFWVASGDAPACGNSYIGYDLNALTNGGTPTVSPEVLQGYVLQDTRHRDGLSSYMLAEFVYQVDKNDVGAMLGHLAAARAADPEESLYYQIAGRFHLRRGFDPDTANAADVETGIELLENSIDDGVVKASSNNEQAVSMLYLGMAYDLIGDRATALKYYNKVLCLSLAEGTGDFLSGLNKYLMITVTGCLVNAYSGEIPDGFSVMFYE